MAGVFGHQGVVKPGIIRPSEGRVAGSNPATLTIVAAQSWHTGTIARRMRQIDKLECACNNDDPKTALRRSLRISLVSCTALVDGRPEAMFGVAPLNALEGLGSPWFLGTDVVFDHPRALLTIGPRYLKMVEGYFPRLKNRVHRDNDRAIRLLRRWGFTVGCDEVNLGGEPFVEFWKG